jgi:hypothetical protein
VTAPSRRRAILGPQRRHHIRDPAKRRRHRAAIGEGPFRARLLETTTPISAKHFRSCTYPQKIPAEDAKVVDFPTDARLGFITKV